MDRPEANTTATAPSRAPENGAASFFPDFASVRTALGAGQVGVWCWDVATNKVTWSSNLESIHDLPPGSFDGTFSFFQGIVHEEDRARVQAAIGEALQTGRPYVVRYRIAPRDRRHEIWIEATGAVALRDGKPEQMVGLCRDVSMQVSLQHELRRRAKQQEVLARLGERALTETDVDRLLNDVVTTVALTLPVGFVEVLELLPGGNDLLLRAGHGWKTGCIGSIIMSKERDDYARRILGAAAPVITAELTGETQFVAPQYLRDHDCTNGMSTIIAGRDGRAYGLLSVWTSERRQFGVQDSSFLIAVANLVAGAIQRRQLEERHELMIRELRHRSGNLFSQLLALFSQTAKNSRNIADLTGKYQARVLALANAHRLITEAGWQWTSLAELLRVVLGPYLDRTSLNGPDVELAPDPTFALSAALHELAANAIKHGSLSHPQGRLKLGWSVSWPRHGATLIFDWAEHGGPPARRPRRTGFGTRLIGLVIERQMNGEVHPCYAREGFSMRIVVPLTHERWPVQAADTAAQATSAS